MCLYTAGMNVQAVRPRFVIHSLFGFNVVLTRGIAMPTHQHHALQLTFSADGPFVCGVGQTKLVSSGVLIGSAQAHATQATPETLFTFLVEPESHAGRQISQALLQVQPAVALRDDLVASCVPALRTLDLEMQLSKPHLVFVFEQIVDRLVGATPAPPGRDERIDEALKRLISLPEKRVSARELSSSVALSESRLLHLFKAETGTTLRAYLLWLRLGQALKLIWAGTPLTEAAHTAGFADAAHLSRTARRTFGTSLSSLVRNEATFQVYLYDETDAGGRP
jgi:AraC family transcriptional regulator